MTGVNEEVVNNQQQPSRCNDKECDYKLSSIAKCFLIRHPKFKLVYVVQKLLAFAILLIPYCVSQYDIFPTGALFLFFAAILIIVACVLVLLSLLLPIVNNQQSRGTGAGCFILAIILILFATAYIDEEYCSSLKPSRIIPYCEAEVSVFFPAIAIQVFYVLVFVLHCKGNEVIHRWFPVSIRIGLLSTVINSWVVAFVFIYAIFYSRSLSLYLYIALTAMTYIYAIIFIFKHRACDFCGVCISNVWCSNIFAVVWFLLSIVTLVELVINGAYVVDGSTTAWIVLLGVAILAIGAHYWLMIEILVGDDCVSGAYAVIADERDDRKENLETV